MAADDRRLRVGYRKDGRLAYLGHLEVINTVERCIRRSGLPFAVGNGFARRMRVQFSQALPVGAFSVEEYYDVMLTEAVPEDEALVALRAATPPALGPTRAAYAPRKAPALEAWLNRASWDVELRGLGAGAAGLDAAIAAVAGRGSLAFMRGDKPRTVDLTSTLVSWEATDEPWGVRLRLETRSSNLGALRPAVLVSGALAEPALAGAGEPALRVCRTAQAHEGENGRLVEPFADTFSCSLT